MTTGTQAHSAFAQWEAETSPTVSNSEAFSSATGVGESRFTRQEEADKPLTPETMSLAFERALAAFDRALERNSLDRAYSHLCQMDRLVEISLTQGVKQ